MLRVPEGPERRAQREQRRLLPNDDAQRRQRAARSLIERADGERVSAGERTGTSGRQPAKRRASLRRLGIFKQQLVCGL